MENFESIAGIIGEPTRAKMLWSLLDGKAYTATELAIQADVSSSNASMHLAKLVQADLLRVERQGRHRYYRLAKPEVAYALEAIANLIPPVKIQVISESETTSIKFCRTCYDHLAGKLAVEIADQFIEKGILISGSGVFELSESGRLWFENFGINIEKLKSEKRSFARQCLDWSERRPHLAGALGAAFFKKLLEEKWIQRVRESRIIVPTHEGRLALHQQLGLWI